MRKWCFIWFLVILSDVISAQSTFSIDSFSINSKDTTALLYHNSIIFNQSDSATANEQQFYMQLKESASRNKITKLLHDIFIKSSGKHSSKSKQDLDNSKYNGKTIRKIDIKQVDVFGASVKDTSRIAKSFLEKSGNAIHKNTSLRTLKKLILLNEKEVFSAFNATENERVIRSRSYIYDCRIVCKPVENDSNKVNLTYIIQDAFSYGLEASGTLKDHEGGIYNNNFLSEGHKVYIGLAHSLNSSARKTLGPNLQYTIRNIYGSFINVHMLARDTYSNYTYRFKLDKKFLTYQTKYAGSFEAQRVRDSRNLFGSDSRNYLSRIDFNSLDMMFGRSYFLNKSEYGLKPNNIIIASRLQRYMFFNLHNFQPDYSPSNFWLLMGEVNLNKSQYKKGNLLYGYGRTEDVPYGYSLKLQVGHRWMLNSESPYLGIRIDAASKLSEKRGYFSGLVSAGGFLRQKDIHEGVLKCQVKYFSPLIQTNRVLSRHFLSAYYIKGFNRLAGDSLYLSNGLQSIEAFDTNSINGLQKLTFSYENVFFLKQRIIGFRLALYSFCDYGGVGINSPLKDDYLSFGVGFRMRNDNLIFNTIQFRLAYFPNTPKDLNHVSFRVSDETTPNFPDFREITATPMSFR